jgi:hypothetical protein
LEIAVVEPDSTPRLHKRLLQTVIFWAVGSAAITIVKWVWAGFEMYGPVLEMWRSVGTPAGTRVSFPKFLLRTLSDWYVASDVLRAVCVLLAAGALAAIPKMGEGAGRRQRSWAVLACVAVLSDLVLRVLYEFVYLAN